tara:strand:- start:222 stop:521 length:300 start_codon:yes stop_codon:yes gene_type:complete
MFVTIKPSTIKGKKYTAIFYDNDKKKVKTTHFGSAGMSDYTIHKDKERRQRYLDRHRKNENWDNYMSAGSLSRYILWNLPTFNSSYSAYRKRFNLKKLS